MEKRLPEIRFLFRMARRKRVIICFFPFIMGGVLIAGLLLAPKDSHHFNWKYRLWEVGYTEFDSEYIRFIGVDTDLQNRLIGCPVKEVEELFPNLRPAINGSPGSFRFLIGNSGWSIEFELGRVKELHQRK